MNQGRTLDLSCSNYRSLIVAGLGVIGQGVLTLGTEFFESFDTVTAIDSNSSMCQHVSGLTDCDVVCGDIRQKKCLSGLFDGLPKPVLFVNLCSGIDTVKLRKVLQVQPVGYVDICESVLEAGSCGCFSVSMPYTNRACHGEWPHLICQGINPGMVEYVSRRIMRQMAPALSGFKITIFENDQLSLAGNPKQPVASWSPADLIEEMLSPSMEFAAGRLLEARTGPARMVTTQWEGRRFSARLVGHEDIWNLGHLAEVCQSRFLYALHRNVMGTLADNRKINSLRIPLKNEIIQGSERIVVIVEHPQTGQLQACLWRTDHAQMQQEYGLNAVQFQTAASTLVSMMLMQHTEIGLRRGTFTASQLPLDGEGWIVLEQFMQRLGIDFVPVKRDYVYCLDETIRPQVCESAEYYG